MVALFDNAAEETAIAALLASPAGYEIGLFDELTAYRLENGKYSVTERIRSRVDQPHDYEKFFDDAQEGKQRRTTPATSIFASMICRIAVATSPSLPLNE